MPKAQPLCTCARSNLRDRVLCEEGKIALLLCQAKRNTLGSCCPKTMCSNRGGFDEEFYSKVLTRVGCVLGLHSSNLVLMSFSGSFNVASGGLSLV